jgi:hypothetical protein
MGWKKNRLLFGVAAWNRIRGEWKGCVLCYREFLSIKGCIDVWMIWTNTWKFSIILRDFDFMHFFSTYIDTPCILVYEMSKICSFVIKIVVQIKKWDGFVWGRTNSWFLTNLYRKCTERYQIFPVCKTYKFSIFWWVRICFGPSRHK